MTQTEIAAATQPNGADMLALWDAGDIVWTVEMGGMGPGYEQAIQTAVIEIIRDNVGKPLPAPDDAENWGDDTLHTHSKSLGGLSGAQAGAAKSLAYRVLRDGYQATLDSMRAHDKDRLTMVSKAWPRAAEAKPCPLSSDRPSGQTPAAVRCPVCGSEKVAPTKGNAVGNVMDCLACYTDFTPRAAEGTPSPATPAPSLRELAELAADSVVGWYNEAWFDNGDWPLAEARYLAAASPAAILELLDKLERAEREKLALAKLASP